MAGDGTELTYGATGSGLSGESAQVATALDEPEEIRVIVKAGKGAWSDFPAFVHQPFRTSR